ncbi:hypothetical protein LshimejAT787_1000950 [Lyophyllum shimeji]|uniref:Uncharacterized protein n=1 Tax=Lyophyllum shimeji TaxID=47721 RepID=A0A9P3PT16_LYOSH|nr:hypothetical protein LshimejAT787_1000950 [Lyophyllum shimeji]
MMIFACEASSPLGMTTVLRKARAPIGAGSWVQRSRSSKSTARSARKGTLRILPGYQGNGDGVPIPRNSSGVASLDKRGRPIDCHRRRLFEPSRHSVDRVPLKNTAALPAEAGA